MQAQPPSRSMFYNLGKALFLIRELRELSLASVARRAGIGKSQLAKYESGTVAPTFDDLNKVLDALGVGYSEFFYTLTVVDQRVNSLGTASLPWPVIFPKGSGSFLNSETSAAFHQVLGDVFRLYVRVMQEAIGGPRLEEAAGRDRDPGDEGKDKDREAGA
jgi:transcriptional regulator with XRE-family HTH domain